MINVNNAVHLIWVKWYDRLCRDVGSSWSRFAWDKLAEFILVSMLGGIRKVRESDLHMLTPFYHSIVHSFAHVNNLFFEANSSESLPQLIWFRPAFPFLDCEWSNAGLISLNDLPLSSGGQIDVIKIWNMLSSTHGRATCYLHCCVLQKMRALFSLDSGS